MRLRGGEGGEMRPKQYNKRRLTLNSGDYIYIYELTEQITSADSPVLALSPGAHWDCGHLCYLDFL